MDIEEIMESSLPKRPNLHIIVTTDGKQCSEANESILHAMIKQLPITFNRCFIANKADDANTYEVDIESIEFEPVTELCTNDLQSADERLIQKEKENVWDSINDFLIVLRSSLKDHAKTNKWRWVYNPQCKYVNLRVDMRSGHCLIMNGSDTRIDPEHLRYQYSVDKDRKPVKEYIFDTQDETTELLKDTLKYLQTENVINSSLCNRLTSMIYARQKMNLDFLVKE
jgi:hypothetical protein